MNVVYLNCRSVYRLYEMVTRQLIYFDRFASEEIKLLYSLPGPPVVEGVVAPAALDD